MEGIHERFLVSVGHGQTVRDFEVVPSVGHYAVLENDTPVAEISVNEDGLNVSSEALSKDVLTAIIEKIQQHDA